MNNLAAIGNALARHEIGTWRGYFAPHGFKQRLKSVVHVLRLLQLLIGPLKVKTQYRSSELIHHVGIQLAESIFIGDLLSTAGHSKPSAVFIADGSFQILAIALVPVEIGRAHV